MSAVEGYRDGWELEHLICEKAGILQPGEVVASGKLLSASLVLERGYAEDRIMLLIQVFRRRPRGNDHNLTAIKF